MNNIGNKRSHNPFSCNASGYTLTEILIALAIVVLFIVLPMLVYSTYLKKSRDLKRKSDLNAVQVALENYKAANGLYPDDEDWEEILVEGGYFKAMPRDPKDGQPIPGEDGLFYRYAYATSDDNTTYRLLAYLEESGTIGSESGANYYIVTPYGAGEQVVAKGSGLPPTATPFPTSSPLLQNTPLPGSTATLTVPPGSTATPTPTVPPGSTVTPSVRPGSSATPIVPSGSTATPTILPANTATPTSSPAGITRLISNVVDSGHGVSLAIGSDGYPIMSFMRNMLLRFAKCNNSSCYPASITYRDLSGAGIGTPALSSYSSITTVADGSPMVVFVFQTAQRNIFAYDCADTSCWTGTLRQLDTTNQSGYYPSITLMNDDSPFITYWHEGDKDLILSKCTNNTCPAGTKAYVHHSIVSASYPSAVTLGTGIPLVAYNLASENDIFSVRCTDTYCTEADTPLEMTNDAAQELFVSAAIGNAGYPMISYYDVTNKDLKYVRCGDLTCSLVSAPVTVDATGDVGAFSSITAGANGFAVISYMQVVSGTYDSPTSANVKIAICNNALCTSPVIRTIDTGNVGSFTDVVVPADGRPFLIYKDQGNGWLKGHKCGSSSC